MKDQDSQIAFFTNQTVCSPVLGEVHDCLPHPHEKSLTFCYWQLEHHFFVPTSSYTSFYRWWDDPAPEAALLVFLCCWAATYWANTDAWETVSSKRPFSASGVISNLWCGRWKGCKPSFPSITFQVCERVCILNDEVTMFPETTPSWYSQIILLHEPSKSKGCGDIGSRHATVAPANLTNMMGSCQRHEQKC